MKRFGLFLGLVLAAAMCLPGCHKGDELRDNQTFNNFIMGLYEEGDAQYKVETGKQEDITEAFIQATQVDADQGDYTAVRRYAREQGVTIIMHTKPVKEGDEWNVTTTVYQVVSLSDDLKENPTGITLCDGIMEARVTCTEQDGKLQELVTQPDGTQHKYGPTSSGINFMEHNLELVTRSIYSEWKVQPDGKRIRVTMAQGFGSRNDSETVGEMHGSCLIPILD